MPAWPTALVASKETWWLQNPSRSGGEGITGSEQVVMSAASRWAASLTVPVQTDAQILAFRSLLAGIDGRAGTITIGPVDVRRAPWVLDPLTGGRLSPASAARSIAANPAYGSNPEAMSTLTFTLAANAAVNATALSISRTRGGVLLPGMYLSIVSRLYMIVDMGSDDGGAGPIEVTIRPWLRAAAASGAAVEFGKPVAQMRLATDDTGQLPLELARSGQVSLDLVESV